MLRSDILKNNKIHNKKESVKKGLVHMVPKDLKEKLLAKSKVLQIWNKITPIMRNEWICYITIVKKDETRKKHMSRLFADLLKGNKLCCWPGCPHRLVKAQKYFK